MTQRTGRLNLSLRDAIFEVIWDGDNEASPVSWSDPNPQSPYADGGSVTTSMLQRTPPGYTGDYALGDGELPSWCGGCDPQQAQTRRLLLSSAATRSSVQSSYPAEAAGDFSPFACPEPPSWVENPRCPFLQNTARPQSTSVPYPASPNEISTSQFSSPGPEQISSWPDEYPPEGEQYPQGANQSVPSYVPQSFSYGRELQCRGPVSMAEYGPIYYNPSRTFTVSPKAQNTGRFTGNELDLMKSRCSDSTYRTPRPTFGSLPPYAPPPPSTATAPLETVAENPSPTEALQATSNISNQDDQRYEPSTGTPIKQGVAPQPPLGRPAQGRQNRTPVGWSQQGFSTATSISPDGGENAQNQNFRERATSGQYIPSPPVPTNSCANTHTQFLQGNSQGQFRAAQSSMMRPPRDTRTFANNGQVLNRQTMPMTAEEQGQRSRVTMAGQATTRQLCPPPSFNVCENRTAGQQSTTDYPTGLPPAPPPSYATSPPTPTPFSNNIFPPNSAPMGEKVSRGLTFAAGTSAIANTQQSCYSGMSESCEQGTTGTAWSYYPGTTNQTTPPVPGGTPRSVVAESQRWCKGRRQVCPPLRHLSTDYGPGSLGTTGTTFSTASREQTNSSNATGSSGQGTTSTSWAYHPEVPSVHVPAAPPPSIASNNASMLGRRATLGARQGCPPLPRQSINTSSSFGPQSTSNTTGPTTTAYQSSTPFTSTGLSTSGTYTTTPFTSGGSCSYNTQSSPQGSTMPVPRTPPPTPASNISPNGLSNAPGARAPPGLRPTASPSSRMVDSTFTTPEATTTPGTTSGQQTSSSADNETSESYSTSNTSRQPTTTTTGSGSQGTTTTDTSSSSCTTSTGGHNPTQGTLISTSRSSSGRYRTNDISSRSQTVPRAPPSSPVPNGQSMSPGPSGSDGARNVTFTVAQRTPPPLNQSSHLQNVSARSRPSPGQLSSSYYADQSSLSSEGFSPASARSADARSPANCECPIASPQRARYERHFQRCEAGRYLQGVQQELVNAGMPPEVMQSIPPPPWVPNPDDAGSNEGCNSCPTPSQREPYMTHLRSCMYGNHQQQIVEYLQRITRELYKLDRNCYGNAIQAVRQCRDVMIPNPQSSESSPSSNDGNNSCSGTPGGAGNLLI